MIKHKILTGFVAAFATLAFILPASASAASEGDLIKIACDAGAEAGDSCRTVYYLGLDGQRHAFPNQDVFYSWFGDFDGVTEIDEAEMNNYTLGKNVTLKPGTSALKFQTSDFVYAVAEGGVLRHYLTPSQVEADYGSDWATNDLIVMPDTFFNDYQVGDDIDDADDYDPAEAERGVLSIDDNF